MKLGVSENNFNVKFSLTTFANVFIHTVNARRVDVNVFEIMLEFARLFKVNSLSAVRADVSFAAVGRASRFHRRNIFRGRRCVRVRKKTY